MKFSAELLGSLLTIDITSPLTPLLRGEGSIAEDVEKCFETTRVFEQKYSRFISGNYLDELNKTGEAKIDDELYSMVHLALKVSQMTDGYFDITLLPVLENAGYGISKEKLKENIGFKNIILSQDKIELRNNVKIDLGSVGKGYMIDKIFKFLDKKYDKFIIDFGGDIRVKGSYEIDLEDPALTPTLSLEGEGAITKNIGRIILENCSIASSSGNRRSFGNSHHLIDPKEKKSISDKQTIFLTHPLASFADIFSTALFVSPIDTAIEVLNTVPNLEGMIIMADGTIHKTKNFAWNQ